MNISRYPKILLFFIRQSWMAAAEYRINYIIWLLIDIAWTLMDLVITTALLGTTQVVGSWDLPKALIAIGVFRIMVLPVWSWFFPAFSELPKLVNEGKLDLLLSKPVNSQFLASIQKFSFNQWPSVLIGIAYIYHGAQMGGIIISLSQILLFLLLMLISSILVYGVYFSSMTLVLYVQRLNNIPYLFTESYYAAGRYPPQIYGDILRRVLISFFPLALMTTVPAESLFYPVNVYQIAYFVSLTVGFLLLSRFLWNTGLRHYSSVSS